MQRFHWFDEQFSHYICDRLIPGSLQSEVVEKNFLVIVGGDNAAVAQFDFLAVRGSPDPAPALTEGLPGRTDTPSSLETYGQHMGEVRRPVPSDEDKSPTTCVWRGRAEYLSALIRGFLFSVVSCVTNESAVNGVLVTFASHLRMNQGTYVPRSPYQSRVAQQQQDGKNDVLRKRRSKALTSRVLRVAFAT